MILRTCCSACLQPLELILESTDLALVRQMSEDEGASVPCPRLCGGQVSLRHDPTLELVKQGMALRETVFLSGKELYRAVNGAGLPDELPVDSAIVRAMLISNRTVRVDIEEAHGKLYLHEIHLEGGVTIHLAAGLRGSQVLKVTKER